MLKCRYAKVKKKWCPMKYRFKCPEKQERCKYFEQERKNYDFNYDKTAII